MESLREYIRLQRRKEIMYLIFSRITFFPLIILLGYAFTGELFLLILFGAVILLIATVTVPRWRKHLNARFDYALRFTKVLEMKTEDLSNSLRILFLHQFPKDLYWIDFKIDPSTFKIDIETYYAEQDTSLDSIDDVRNSIKDMLAINESIITGLRKEGWGAVENIELSLELIQKWFSETWDHTVSSEFKIRATFSVKNRIGYFNMRSKKWEDTNILDQPLG